MRLQLGETVITIAGGYTRTTFADGAFVDARHDDVGGLGQAATAHELGYATVAQMNRDHDPCHAVVAMLLGLPYSCVLYALAHGQVAPYAWQEEAAVLAIQRLAQVYAVDLVAVAQRFADMDGATLLSTEDSDDANVSCVDARGRGRPPDPGSGPAGGGTSGAHDRVRAGPPPLY